MSTERKFHGLDKEQANIASTEYVTSEKSVKKEARLLSQDSELYQADAYHEEIEPKSQIAEGSQTKKTLHSIEQSHAGQVLGIAKKSAFDLLPSKIKERREEFLRNKDCEKNPKVKSQAVLQQGDNSEHVTARFYSRVQRVQQRMHIDQSKKKSRFSRQNIQALLVCALLFALWILWNEFLGPSDTELSIQDMQSRLPIVIDTNTKISKAEEKDDGLHLLIEKNGNEYADLDDTEARVRKDHFLERARMLCRNELFGMYVRSGKVLHVSLKTDDGRPDRNISVDKCPASPSAG